MTSTTLNPGLDPIHVESGINMSITRNGTFPCRHIPVTNVPSEESSKWSTPMWAKNIIPNVVWTDGDIFSPAPLPLKLGYHRSVDAHYLLLTTRELPECSALGYGLDQVRTFSFNKSQTPLCPYFSFYCSIMLCHFTFPWTLDPFVLFPHTPLLFRVSHPTLPHSLSSFPFK